MDKDLMDSFKALHELQQQAVMVNMPYLKSEVAFIIENEIEEENKVGRVLDQLVELAFDDDILLLMKKLCRYYLYKNPETTAFYINEYREMWDNE